MSRSYAESIRTFQALDHKRGVARVLECLAASVAAQAKPERALAVAGAAAALRQGIGAPLNPAEQAKLDKGLESARQSLNTAAGIAAWMEGWTAPLESIIEQALSGNAQTSGLETSA